MEDATATHSGILACRIPWTEEPGGAAVHGGPKESDATERLSLSFPSGTVVKKIPLPMQGTRVRSVLWGRLHPQRLSPCSTATEAHTPYSLCLETREATAVRSPLSPQLQSSPPTPFTATRETPQAAMKAQCSQKRKKKKKHILKKRIHTRTDVCLIRLSMPSKKRHSSLA